jgi:hypothetical protein
VFSSSVLAVAIGVLQAHDNHMPIGMAMSAGPDRAGVACWRLTVHGAEVPGFWVVVDQEFRPVERRKLPGRSTPTGA